MENIIPDLLSRRDGPDCTPNTESIKPRYLYKPIKTAAAILTETTDNHKDRLITDPLQDWPLFYFKDPSLWPESRKQQLSDKQKDFVVQNQHVFEKK